MADIHPDLIERYQMALEKDPKSQVFAPLSEAYRKMGLIDEAFRISTRGVSFHPHFASGHIALANVLMAKKQWANAKESLEKAVALSPENILAYQQLAECCLQLKSAKEALKAFKMVLFFSPTNKRAITAVQKLESLTADEYEEDLFSMDRIQSLGQKSPMEKLKPQLESTNPSHTNIRTLESRLSVIDAYIARSDFENAFKLLEALEIEHPGVAEIQKRKTSMLQKLQTPEPKNKEGLKPRSVIVFEEKMKFLTDLKRKIEEEIRLRDVQSP